jgi:hypothetical protein
MTITVLRNLTWVEIVKDYLENNNYDCLNNGAQRCYCKINNIFPCNFDAHTFGCRAGNIKLLEDDYKKYLDE